MRIQHRLNSAGYSPGQALPTGLIAHRLQTTRGAVIDVLAELADRRVVEYRANGEHGPGYYLPGPSTRGHRELRTGAAA
ncbi:hypothetical protein [Streptomyces microflavus]|uniref:hypothetical protein n=1 Tax=Streptomyces microflavus TaxID=1919 RepID=UPI003814FA38